MKIITIVICAVVICCRISPTASVACRSYGMQNGKCINLSRCPPLLAVILSKEKTTEHIRILQQLTCLAESTSSSEPIVCCPEGEIVSSSYIQEDVLQNRHPTTIKTTRPTISSTQRTRTIARVSPTITSPSSLVVYPTAILTTTKRPSQNKEQLGEDSLSEEEQLLLDRKFMTLIPPLANCSLSDVTGGRIIGGTDADHGEYPMMARLGYKNLKSGKIDYYCGGTVLNSRYILTAAHCTFGYDESFELVHVRLGEHNTKELTDCSHELGSCSIPENIPVEKVITHSEYDTANKKNDIALLRVNRDIGFQTFFIKPVCLPFKQYGLPETKLSSFTNGIVVGWGRTNWTRSEGSSVLQHVKLPIVPTEKCVRDFRNRVKLTDEQLCAGGERNQDSCGGDSGGPLLVDTIIGERSQFSIKRKFQYGIVSFGPIKCGIGIPGVYTRVHSYLPWILRNIDP